MIRVLLIFEDTSNFGRFVNLLEVVIWPLTLLVIIFLFRDNFKEILKRIASIEASATGISLTFKEVAEEAKELASAVTPLAIAKSGIQINPRKESSKSPKEIIRSVQAEMESMLRQMGQEHGIPSNNLSTRDIAIALEQKNLLTYPQRKLIEHINRLIAISHDGVTDSQAKEIQNLRNALINN